jgi:hypothetical protein
MENRRTKNPEILLQKCYHPVYSQKNTEAQDKQKIQCDLKFPQE